MVTGSKVARVAMAPVWITYSIMWLNEIVGHGAGWLISWCGSTIKSTWVCTVPSRYPSWFDLICCKDAKLQQPINQWTLKWKLESRLRPTAKFSAANLFTNSCRLIKEHESKEGTNRLGVLIKTSQVLIHDTNREELSWVGDCKGYVWFSLLLPHNKDVRDWVWWPNW